MTITRLAGALLCALAILTSAPSRAADPNLGRPIAAFSGSGLPATGIYCPDANGLAAICAFGGIPATAGGTPGSGTLTFCQVVSGDQAYTAGTTQACGLTATGRIRVTNAGRYVLLSNATASGAVITDVHGGGYRLKVDGTFGGATLTFYTSDSTGTLVARRTFTAAGSLDINIGQGVSVQMQVSGGTPTGLYALLQGVGSAIPESPPAAEAWVQLALAANTRAQLATPIVANNNGITCKASPNNAADIMVGGSTVSTTADGTGNGWPISPGEQYPAAVASSASLWFISASAAVLFCHGN